MEITDIYKYKRLLYDPKKHTLTDDVPHKEILVIAERLPYIVDIPIPKDAKELMRLTFLIRARITYIIKYKVKNPQKRGKKSKWVDALTQTD